jgi:hypothetical protein
MKVPKTVLNGDEVGGKEGVPEDDPGSKFIGQSLSITAS